MGFFNFLFLSSPSLFQPLASSLLNKMSRFSWECDCGFTNLVDEAVCFNCEAGKPQLQSANEDDERPAKKAKPSESDLLPSGAMPETVAVTHENAEVAVGGGSRLEAASESAKKKLNYGAVVGPAARAKQFPSDFVVSGQALWCVSCHKPVQ